MPININSKYFWIIGTMTKTILIVGDNDLNLKYFNENIEGLLEVSIGHALISDALYLGLENAVQLYQRELRLN